MYLTEDTIVNVIQIMDNFNVGGGVNSFVYDLCYALKSNGCSVCLIGILSDGFDNNPEIKRLRDNGIRVKCLGAKSKADAVFRYKKRLRELLKTVSRNKKTICNLHLKLSVLMGVVATIGLRNIKCIETYHNTYHHYHLQCWICSPFIKKYITVSETAKNEMHNRFLIPYKRILAIPNGVPREKIRLMVKTENTLHDDELVRVVSVGRLSYEKNFKIAVQALVELSDNSFTYILIGSGPEEIELKKLAQKNPRINMMGALSRENTLSVVSKADIVLMPSLWEGRSIFQLEAMALDKPLIISDVPGLRETFGEPGLEVDEQFRVCSFGYLVRTLDCESYKSALKHFSTNKDEIKEKMIDSIRTVSAMNDIKKTAVEYIECYKSV